MLTTSCSDDGAVATEYAVLASLIAVVIAVAVAQVGGSLLAIFLDFAGRI